MSLSIQNSLQTTPRLNLTPQFTFSPTITASSAYASGNQIGQIIQIKNVIRQNGNVYQDGISGWGQAELHSIKILDADHQNAPIDFFFFQTSPSLTNAGNKTAYSITGANQKAAGGQGALSLGVTYSASSVASMSTDGANLSLNIWVPSTSTTPNDCFVVAVVRGTPTYTTTSSLTFLFNFYAD